MCIEPNLFLWCWCSQNLCASQQEPGSSGKNWGMVRPCFAETYVSRSTCKAITICFFLSVFFVAGLCLGFFLANKCQSQVSKYSPSLFFALCFKPSLQHWWRGNESIQAAWWSSSVASVVEVCRLSCMIIRTGVNILREKKGIYGTRDCSSSWRPARCPVEIWL